MGIKGIYGEIGPGERVSLSKLAIEKIEKENRPLRVAIDVSIWQFQTLSGQGGSNPAIRTFYYRLIKLLSFSVQPLFVFDGPNKPPFKRGKKTGHHGDSVPNLMTKQMLDLFGFPYHMAPGEAEAECALLQREGLVDAVLSEDVDTLMFGCGLTFRNWSSEGTRGNKSPTHVSVYDAKATKAGKSGLDREGMVLVALMSGGDYIKEGIPHCGIKVACEAARAGFGKSLCKLANNDTAGIADWRNNLDHEIRTNESGYFRVKHKSLVIPENFPNREVLGYYTNPVVSTAAKINSLRIGIVWDGPVDVDGLRQFVGQAFDWSGKIGATKFIRNLAPALLVHKLRLRGDRRDSGYGDVVLTAANEMELVRAIAAKRNHFSVDGIDELRVVYRPIDIVGIDLEAEHDDSMDYSRSGLATNDADDQDLEIEDDGPKSPSKRGASIFDPTEPDKLWIPRTIAKLGVPLKVEDYEESLRNPKKFFKAKAVAKRAGNKSNMPKGAIEKFVTTSKPSRPNENFRASTAPSKVLTMELDLPPGFLAPSLERSNSAQPLTTNANTRAARTTRASRISTDSTTKPAKKTAKGRATTSKPQANTNPWTMAKPGGSPESRLKVSKATIDLVSSSPVAAFKSPSHWVSSSPPVERSPSPPPPTQTSVPSPLGRKHVHSPVPSPALSETEFALPASVTINRNRSRRTVNSSRSQEPSTPSKTNKSRDPLSPSPRKKISPNYPTSHQPSARKENNPARKLDFSPSAPPISTQRHRISERDSSPKEDLPALEDLYSPPKSKTTSVPTFKPASMTTNGQEEARIKKKKYIMLRQSLVGAWKEVEDDNEETGTGGEGDGEERKMKWRYSEVDMLDLSQE